jgi:hypothetical protein
VSSIPAPRGKPGRSRANYSYRKDEGPQENTYAEFSLAQLQYSDYRVDDVTDPTSVPLRLPYPLKPSLPAHAIPPLEPPPYDALFPRSHASRTVAISPTRPRPRILRGPKYSSQYVDDCKLPNIAIGNSQSGVPLPRIPELDVKSSPLPSTPKRSRHPSQAVRPSLAFNNSSDKLLLQL